MESSHSSCSPFQSSVSMSVRRSSLIHRTQEVSYLPYCPTTEFPVVLPNFKQRCSDRPASCHQPECEVDRSTHLQHVRRQSLRYARLCRRDASFAQSSDCRSNKRRSSCPCQTATYRRLWLDAHRREARTQALHKTSPLRCLICARGHRRDRKPPRPLARSPAASKAASSCISIVEVRLRRIVDKLGYRMPDSIGEPLIRSNHVKP